MMRRCSNLSRQRQFEANLSQISGSDIAMSFQGLLPPSEDVVVKYIYQSILEPACWRSFLQCLRQRLDCDIAAMLLRSSGSSSLTYAIWERRLPLAESECKAAVSEYKNLAHLDPLLSALKTTGEIYTLDEVIARKDLIQSEYYHRIIKRFDFEHQLAMYLSEPNGLECYIGVVNGAAGSNFGAAEKQYLSALQSHINCALRIYSQLHRDEIMVAIYSAALANLPLIPLAGTDIES